jgi:inosose dehydratase
MCRVSCHLGLWGERFQEGMQFVGQTGFNAIEIGSKFFLSYEQRLNEWRQLTAESGVEVSAVYEFGHFDRWDKRREIYLHHDRLAHVLERAGIQAAVLGPGIKFHKHDAPQDRHHLIAMVSETAKRYQAHGVNVGIHPHWGHCIFTLQEIDYVMQHVPDAIGLVPDLGHTAEANIDILALLSRYQSRIQNIHLKDYKRIEGAKNVKIQRDTKFCELGEGESNIREMMQLLQEQAYSGWLTAEVEDSQTAPEISVRSTKVYFEKMKMR